MVCRFAEMLVTDLLTADITSLRALGRCQNLLLLVCNINYKLSFKSFCISECRATVRV